MTGQGQGVEVAVKVAGWLLTLAVAAGAVFLGYWLFHRWHPDPWDLARAGLNSVGALR